MFILQKHFMLLTFHEQLLDKKIDLYSSKMKNMLVSLWTPEVNIFSCGFSAHQHITFGGLRDSI